MNPLENVNNYLQSVFYYVLAGAVVAIVLISLWNFIKKRYF